MNNGTERTMVVTGGGSGMGREIAVGARRVARTAHDRKSHRRTIEGSRRRGRGISWQQADAGMREDIQKALRSAAEQAGHIGVLVTPPDSQGAWTISDVPTIMWAGAVPDVPRCSSGHDVLLRRDVRPRLNLGN
jgi:NAD(P)-dependent dehydrogenase (short-subunit alcohol dehydrogenase family)